MNEIPSTAPESVPPALPTAAPEAPAVELPAGFWRSVDYLLHNPESVSRSIRRDEHLPALIRFFSISILLLGALYGTVMGLLSLLQGEAVSVAVKAGMPALSAVKLPALYFLTLFIIFPPIYVMNAFAGAKLGFRKMAAVMLFGTAVTLMLLASLATVALFFSLTSRNASFVKLLHMVFFLFAGWAGWSQMLRCLGRSSAGGARPAATPAWLTACWIGLYAFVGLELSWVMRPYFGTPGQPFEFFRPRGGNLYEAMIRWSEEVASPKPVKRNVERPLRTPASP